MYGYKMSSIVKNEEKSKTKVTLYHKEPSKAASSEIIPVFFAVSKKADENIGLLVTNFGHIGTFAIKKGMYFPEDNKSFTKNVDDVNDVELSVDLGSNDPADESYQASCELNEKFIEVLEIVAIAESPVSTYVDAIASYRKAKKD